jgi:hypothetical protein
MIISNRLSNLSETTADGVCQSSRQRPDAVTQSRMTQPCQFSVTCSQFPLLPRNSQVTQMLHLAQSKPQIHRTKRFPIAYTRNKPITSSLFSTSAPSRTPTISIAQDRIAHITNNSTMCVAVTLHLSNSPRSKNLNSLEQNIPSATRRGSRDATSNFYSSAFLKPIASSRWPAHVGVMSKYFDTPNRINRDFPKRNTTLTTNRRRSTPTRNFYYSSAHLVSIASSLSPVHVRVLSEYSYIPNQTNHDFLEQNDSSDPRRRKSTLTRKKCAQSKQPNRSESRSNKPNVEKRNPCFGNTKIASQYRSHSMGNSRERTLPRQKPETVDFSTQRPCLFPFRGKVSVTQKKNSSAAARPATSLLSGNFSDLQPVCTKGGKGVRSKPCGQPLGLTISK